MTFYAKQDLAPSDTQSTAAALKSTKRVEWADDELLLDGYDFYLKPWGEPSSLIRGLNATKSIAEGLKDRTLSRMLGVQRSAHRRLRQVWSQARAIKLR